MCGISGIVNFDKTPDLNLINKINNKIKYRGPDNQETWNNSFCSLGIVRLKIIDLSDNSNQPFVDKSQV